MLIDKCPVCGSESFVALGPVTEGMKVYLKDHVLQHPAFSINECKVCKVFFKSDIPDFNTLSLYYKKLDNSYEDLDFLFPTDLMIIREVRNTGNNLKILDYGCGTGRILNQLESTYQKFGTEVNEDSIAIATKRNIQILTETELKEHNHLFDIIILTDVFEHLFEPLKLLTELKNKLSPGGKLLMVTGDSDAIKKKKFAAGYWYLQTFSHLQMLNRANVKWIANALQMTPEKMINSSHYTTSVKVTVKHFLANILFDWFRKMPSLKIWNKKFAFVKQWKYPAFESNNADHLFVALKK